MDLSSELCNEVFEQTIGTYHQKPDVEQSIDNPYQEGDMRYLIFRKSWIDNIQWHLEDEIRDPGIDPVAGLKIKRRIDAFNQERTDMVELIDSIILKSLVHPPLPGATLNTETPAWAIDRLSVLSLKIFHMRQETVRDDASEEHIVACRKKLDVLLDQQKDLSAAINQLLADIQSGQKILKLYKQMKMYNDPALNPVLYK